VTDSMLTVVQVKSSEELYIIRKLDARLACEGNPSAALDVWLS
jgi:hypothetical protein